MLNSSKLAQKLGILLGNLIAIGLFGIMGMFVIKAILIVFTQLFL